MKAFVFTDPALTSSAGRFVWLEVDTEREQNAPVLQKYPVEVWPSFFFVDPRDERVLMRWVGSMTVPQAQAFFEDGMRAYAGDAPAAADAALAAADRVYGQGKNSDAAVLYKDALAKAPADWPAYGRASEALLFALQRSKAHAEAIALARQVLPRLRGTAHGFTIGVGGLDSAVSLPDDDPQRAAAVAELEAEVRSQLADARLKVAADDRSGAYGVLLDARKRARDEAGTRKVAAEWAAFLEAEAAAAGTAEQRMVFDSHRLGAYIELGEPQRAIPMLEASQRDAPDDYNPPARLAVAYQAMKEWDRALAASERALARVYGLRKLRVMGVHAEIQQAKGDLAGARRTLEQALAHAEALPAGQRSEAWIAAIKKRLEAVPAAASP
jgi:tetratricopeptide (TPR) repeat protein